MKKSIAILAVLILAFNTYAQLTVSDGNMCEAYADVTLVENPELSASITDFSNVTCNGDGNGSATVEAQGVTEPYTYFWDDPLEQTSATATGLSGGTYTITVIDVNNCEAETSITITEPDELIAQADFTEIACYGETSEVIVTATGGTEPYSGTGTFSEAAGTYTYTVTDANGCTDDISITITQPTELIANAGADVTACGSYSGQLGNIVNGTANGGTPGYAYAWNPEEYLTGASGEHPVTTINAPGIYTFIVTVTDANNCTTTDEVTITVYDAPEITLTADQNIICSGGNSPVNITATASNGQTPYSYQWSHDESLDQANIVVSPLGTTTYYVTVSDLNSCIAYAQVTVYVENYDIECSFSYASGDDYGYADFVFTPDELSADDFDITIVNTNDPTLLYAYTDQLPAGNLYNATFISTNGCQYECSFNMPHAESFNCSANALPITCENSYNAAINFNIEGGIPPYHVILFHNGIIYDEMYSENGNHTIDLTRIIHAIPFV